MKLNHPINPINKLTWSSFKMYQNMENKYLECSFLPICIP